MKFTIQRELLLKPLQMVVGVVERRQTLPILANILVTGSPSPAVDGRLASSRLYSFIGSVRLTL